MQIEAEESGDIEYAGFDKCDIRRPDSDIEDVDSSIDVLAVLLGYPPDGEDEHGTMRTGQHWDAKDNRDHKERYNRAYNTYLFEDPDEITRRLEAIING